MLMEAERTPLAAELVSLEWERIQLRLRLRLSSTADPGGLALAPRPGDGAPEPMPPTGIEDEPDGVVRIRFNVFLGPGQLPLAPGRWWLVHDGEPVVLEAPGLAAGSSARAFVYRGGHSTIDPHLEGSTLVIEVAHERHARRSLRFGWLRSRRTLVRRVRQWLFDRMVRLFRATRRFGSGRRRVLLTSDSRANLSGNLAIVHARMLERGLDRQLDIDSIFKPSVATERTWRDRWRLPRLMAQADVILLDDYQPAIYRLPPHPAVRIVQLWHASGALKTVGYSRIGKPGGPSPFAMRHKNYTHAIVSGSHDVPFYAEAFGLPEERVLPTGIPRMDRFFDPEQRAAGVALARRLFPMIAGRFVILFAPTFRGSGPRTAHYPPERLDLPALHAVAEARDAVVLVRMHPFIREPLAVPAGLSDRIVDASTDAIDVNDLLFAVDLLVTDYSSIVFEFSTLERPMLFYAFDLDEYVAERDFYVPFEEFVPGRIVRTFDELLDAIRTDEYEAHKVTPFARRHFDHLDGNATDRIIDEIILAP